MTYSSIYSSTLGNSSLDSHLTFTDDRDNNTQYLPKQYSSTITVNVNHIQSEILTRKWVLYSATEANAD